MASTFFALCLLLALSVNARPDGTGGHHDHGHHAEHAAAAPSSGYVEPAPAANYAAPSTSYSSSSSYAAPSSGYAAPASGYGAPDAGYAAPDAGYGAPSTGYGAPDVGYGAPDAGYGAPDAGYGAPDAGYGAPDTGYGYGAPSTGYGGDAGAGGDGGIAGTGLSPLTAIIIPIMLLAGLALLFPSTVNVPVNGGGRKKRSSGDEEESTQGIADKMLDIMSAVATSEQCMERIACEVGSLANDYGVDKKMTKSMAKLTENFMTKKTHKLLKKFNGSEDCRKIKCLMF